MMLQKSQASRYIVIYASIQEKMLNISQKEKKIIFSVPCAVGTYFDQANKTCNPCPQGSYQSETGQLQCLRCPNIAGRIGVTSGSGARSAADCKGNNLSILLTRRLHFISSHTSLV